jgi:hypothetical protein
VLLNIVPLSSVHHCQTTGHNFVGSFPSFNGKGSSMKDNNVVMESSQLQMEHLQVFVYCGCAGVFGTQSLNLLGLAL